MRTQVAGSPNIVLDEEQAPLQLQVDPVLSYAGLSVGESTRVSGRSEWKGEVTVDQTTRGASSGPGEGRLQSRTPQEENSGEADQRGWAFLF